ncbi:MAG: lipopolysaccharide transport periplasmic protein LptA [Thermodesulfobacteria bacterium]|nr:lipopolysaccharide transport periplasmic protein LptA [Thermodesulfobacteriota bacterium]
MFFWVLWFLLVLCLVVKSAIADELNISSNKMEAFDSEGLAVFTGDVVATKPGFKLTCDKMYVYYYTDPAGKKKVKKIVALGGVVIRTPEWKAYADKAVYFKKEEKLILENDAKVWYGKNLIEGDKVIVYFNQDKSEVFAENQGRVKAQFLLK